VSFRLGFRLRFTGIGRKGLRFEGFGILGFCFFRNLKARSGFLDLKFDKSEVGFVFRGLRRIVWEDCGSFHGLGGEIWKIVLGVLEVLQKFM